MKQPIPDGDLTTAPTHDDDSRAGSGWGVAGSEPSLADVPGVGVGVGVGVGDVAADDGLRGYQAAMLYLAAVHELLDWAPEGNVPQRAHIEGIRMENAIGKHHRGHA